MAPLASPAARARGDGAHPRLADAAVQALLDEARLTPKPGLVDARGSGAHADLDLATMIRSAQALRAPFRRMARAAGGRRPTQALREELGAIGRDAEAAMLAATGGANAHRGAIWALGLLVAGAAMAGGGGDAAVVAAGAAALARRPDRRAAPGPSHGSVACARYGVEGARGEAAAGFPHVVDVGLPALAAARRAGASEEDARLDALLAVMSSLDDTCLLHRGGRPALEAARAGAAAVLGAGGCSTARGRAALGALEAALLARNASPGGSADLLAGVLFLDAIGAARPRAAWAARR